MIKKFDEVRLQKHSNSKTLKNFESNNYYVRIIKKLDSNN